MCLWCARTEDIYIRNEKMRILHIRRTQICISCAVHSRLCDYERRTLNEIECRIFFQTIYAVKSQCGGFAYILFHTLMIYMIFIQVTYRLLQLLLDCLGRKLKIILAPPPPPQFFQLASAALYLLHREKKIQHLCAETLVRKTKNKKYTKEPFYVEKFYWRQNVLRTLKTFHASLVMVFF